MSSTDKEDVTALAPNQVRKYTNRQGHSSYYIVIQDPSTNKYGALWFRNNNAENLHIAMKFNPSVKHKLIMRNINILRDTFEHIDKELAD